MGGGPEHNPADDVPADKAEYEKWEAGRTPREREPLTPDQRKELQEQSRKHLEHLQRVAAAYGRMVDIADPLEREPTDAFLILTAAAGKMVGFQLRQLADLLDCCASVKPECALQHKEPEDFPPYFRSIVKGQWDEAPRN